MTLFHLQFEAAALALLIVVLVLFLKRRHITFIASRVFAFYLVFALVNISLDIAATLAIRAIQTIPLAICYLLNTLYLATQLLLPAILVTYLLIIMNSMSKEHLKVYFVVCIPALLGAVTMLALNYSTHWYFYFDSALVYQHGPAHFLIYANAGAYTVAALIVSIVFRKNITALHFRATITIVAIMILSIAAQALFPNYMLTGIGLAFGILVMMLSLQNPEEDVDDLCGLPTRRMFKYNTERLLKKSNEPYVMLYFNVRHCKAINDLFGPQVGDRVLIILADKLKQMSRGIGTCGRIEGDNFAMCLPNASFDLDVCLAETGPELFAKHVVPRVSVSFGIYLIVENDEPINVICDRAQAACQVADSNHSSRAAFFDIVLRANMIEDQALIDELPTALAQNQFELFYQPVFDTSTGAMIGAETLVRWMHPTRGIILPARFLPLFEKTGAVVKLDSFLWRVACEGLYKSMVGGLEDFSISVNCSYINLYNHNLGREFQNLMDEFGVSPERLHFEISESGFMKDTQTFGAALSKLNAQGFVTLMDDFGQGYSSLGILKDAPFDKLKIDVAFLLRNDEDGRGHTILKTIIKTAQEMGFFVVAEGIENASQARFIEETGCDAVQGFYYGLPVPRSEFETLLASEKARRESM